MSLVWRSQRPRTPGWYWMNHNGVAEVVHVFDKDDELFVNRHARHMCGDPLRIYLSTVQWAGPIARPKEPSKEMLSTVRYKLDGAHLAPATSGWGSAEWSFKTRLEMLKAARVCLCGGQNSWGEPVEADSQWVNLFTSRRRCGRWGRQAGERFTATNIDAAIAAEAAKGAKG